MVQNVLEERCVSGLHILHKIGKCDKCAAIRKAIWNSKNPIEAQAKYNRDNEKALEDAARFCKKRDQILREQDIERLRASELITSMNTAARNKINRSHRRAISNNIRSRRIKAYGVLSSGILDRLFVLQKGKCPCCKKKLGNDFHMDHIVPLSKGGTNTDDNIQLLRKECNLRKSAKDPLEFMKQNGFLL